jgi:hypothetical protein
MKLLWNGSKLKLIASNCFDNFYPSFSRSRVNILREIIELLGVVLKCHSDLLPLHSNYHGNVPLYRGIMLLL